MKHAMVVCLSSLVLHAYGCNNRPSTERSRRPAVVRVLTDAATQPPRDVPPPRPIDVQAGSSIGPVRIGSQRAEVESLGLDAHPTGAPDTVVYGPYTVHFSGTSGVDRIEVPLSVRSAPLGFTVYGTPLPSDLTSLQRVLDVIGNCAAPEANEGGTVALCYRGKLMVVQSSAEGPILLRVVPVVVPPPAAGGAVGGAARVAPAR